MPAIQYIVETYVIPLQLILAMLGMGATIRLTDFGEVAREAKGVCLGLILQLLLVPALAVAFIHAFDLSKGWAVGLLLVAVIPGGAFSNLITLLARGRVVLSVSVTLASTLLCLGSVPWLLGLLAGQYLPVGFVMPIARIAQEILLYLLVPLAAGMVLLRVAPVRARRISNWTVRLSTWLLGLVVVSSLGSGRIELGAYGWQPPLVLALFGTVLATITPWICRLMRCYDDDNVALSTEVAVRNVGLGLLLVRIFFVGEPEQGQVLYTCLYYGGMQFFMVLPMLLLHRRGFAPILGAPPRPRPKHTRAASSMGASLHLR